VKGEGRKVKGERHNVPLGTECW